MTGGMRMKTAGMKCSAFRLRAFKYAYEALIEPFTHCESARILRGQSISHAESLVYPIQYPAKSLLASVEQFNNAATLYLMLCGVS